MRIKTHSEIITGWPGGIKVLAEDIGVPFNTVRGWKVRDSIPLKYWPAIFEKASERNAYAPTDVLVQAKAQRRAA